MLFNSIAFLIFAPIFYVGYFNLRGKARLVWCIFASYFFYAWWDWRFVGLILGSTLVAFYSGRMIGRADSARRKRFWILLCLFSHLMALGFFKYFNFFADSLKSVFGLLGYSVTYMNPTILLPVGISFYTFTALSYTIDVYRGKIAPPERSLLRFATYECIFPHLVAGPILRASTFLPQLEVDYSFDWRRAGRGLEMIAWGYLLKLCLADNAALFVDPRFDHPELFNSVSLVLAALAFAFQIYGDFAGYSLIAIGLARIMGYDFGNNFNKPYFAANFSEFWQRWHISLSNWIRDYLYISLGGSKRGRTRMGINLIVTMFLAGLWHGAGWNYVVWGLLHGSYLVLQRVISKPYQAVCRSVRCPELLNCLLSIITVFMLTCMAWIFFRAGSVGEAVSILRSILSWQATSHLSFGGMKFQLLRVFSVVLIVLVVDLLSSCDRVRALYERQAYARAFIAGIAVLVILFTGNFASNSFIYFQF